MLGLVKEAPPALPGETALNYRLFVEYWRRGGKVGARELAEAMGCGKTSVWRWSRQFRWDERLNVAIAEASVESPAEAAVWAKRKEEVRQREWELHREAVELAVEAIRRWKEAKKTRSLADISKMFEIASKLGRLATGLGTEVGSGEGGGSSPLRLEFQAALLKVYGRRKEEESEAVVDVEAECAPLTVES